MSHYLTARGLSDGIMLIDPADAPALADLDPTYRDVLNPRGNCPGFHLWACQGDNGRWYLIASDAPGGAETRLYFRTRGVGGSFPSADEASGLVSRVVRAAYLGENPDEAAWDRMRANGDHLA
jgi:hypothetical protein